ncbi:MAG: protein kinase [Armatimonadetes bacterium]|nr:protein kinase [Armatimonadota bacterium]
MIGKILNNRYKIEEKIGEGGMAVIYKAKDLRLNRLVALKILRAEFLSDAEFVERFLKEANFSAKLSHPNCLNIYDVEKTENLLYIVMEYFESKNLKEIIKIEAPFSIEKALEIIQNIISALEYAHQSGIIHRDIKPHNILINQEGLVKITDFGIAKAISSTTLTQNGNLIGSVHYLSPEQAQGKEVNLTSDIYSLGIIIYEMLTGKLPFQGENIVEIALKQVQEEPVLPSSLNPKIPPFLEKIILKILAKDPQKRCQNIAELKEDLKVVYKEIKKEKVDLDKTFIKRPLNLSTKMKIHKNNNLLLLLILILITLLYLSGKYFIVRVPNLINLSYENAAKVLKESGLSIKIKGYSYKKDLAELIIEQNPIGGKKVLRGGVIEVILNKVEGEVKVPNLIGMTLEAAQKELSNLSLAYQIEKETPSTMAKETIISQHPAPFTLVGKNSLIFLELSSGNLEKLIPNIVGLSKDE